MTTRNNKRVTVTIHMLIRVRHVITRFKRQHLTFSRNMFTVNSQKFRNTNRTLSITRNATSRIYKRFRPRPMPQFRRSTITLRYNIQPTLSQHLKPTASSDSNFRRPLAGHAVNNLTRITTFNVLRVHTTDRRDRLSVNRQHTGRRARVLALNRINRGRPLPVTIRVIFKRNQTRDSSTTQLP